MILITHLLILSIWIVELSSASTHAIMVRCCLCWLGVFLVTQVRDRVRQGCCGFQIPWMCLFSHYDTANMVGESERACTGSAHARGYCSAIDSKVWRYHSSTAKGLSVCRYASSSLLLARWQNVTSRNIWISSFTYYPNSTPLSLNCNYSISASRQ